MRPGTQNPFQNGGRLNRASSVHGVTDEALAEGLNHLAHPKDAALFVTKPQMSDVRQGASGQCFIDAALLSIIYSDPYFLTAILHKEGETLTAQLHRRDKDGEFRSLNLVVEHSDFQPVDGAELHTHAAWASSLVKAYGIVRAKFYEASKDEKLDVLKHIAHGGQPADVFEMLTGHIPEVISIGQDETKNIFFLEWQNSQAAFAEFITAWRNALRAKSTETAEVLFVEFKESISTSQIAEPYKSLILTQLEQMQAKCLEAIDSFRKFSQDVQDTMFVHFAFLSAAQALPQNNQVPQFILTIAEAIKKSLSDTYQVDFSNISTERFTPSKTPRAALGEYNPSLRFVFSKIESGTNAGKYITASSEKFSSTEKAAEHAGEAKQFGLVGEHAYAVLGTCKRTDEHGRERCFIRLKNPWQHFAPEYTENGSRHESRDSKGLATREYEQSKLFGAKKHSSSDFTDPQIPSLSTSAEGLFELELEDFCRHFSTLTLCERANPHTKLLHDLQAFLATTLNYTENETLRDQIAGLLSEFDAELEWERPEHLILVLCNQLKKIKLPHNYTISEHTFAEFCEQLNEVKNDNGYVDFEKVAALLKNYALKSQEIYGYGQKPLLEERIREKAPKNLKAPISHIMQLDLKPADKIVQLYFYLASRLKHQKLDEDKEAIHQLLFDIRQHWKSCLHECSHLIEKGYRVEETKLQRDFYSYLNETAFIEARKIIENKKSEIADEQHYQQITKQIQTQAKMATQAQVIKFAKRNPWNSAIIVLSLIAVIVGIALQFSGVGAPMGWLLIKAGYTKFATATAARIAIMNAVLSTAICAALGAVAKFLVSARQHIKDFFRGSRSEYKAVATSPESSPECSASPCPSQLGSVQKPAANNSPISVNPHQVFARPSPKRSHRSTLRRAGSPSLGSRRK